jgi:hypothetical protein
MGGACSRYWGKEKCILAFDGENRERGHMEDPGQDERIILGLVFRKWDGSMVWLGIGIGSRNL